MTNQRCMKRWMRVLMTMMCCALATGCALSDPQYRAQKPAKHPQARVTLDLLPGQVIEAVIVEPAKAIKQRRVRARIDDSGAVAFDTLGVFDTRGHSLSQLEQDMLNTLNQGRRLQGTLRLSLVETHATLPAAE